MSRFIVISLKVLNNNHTIFHRHEALYFDSDYFCEFYG